MSISIKFNHILYGITALFFQHSRPLIKKELLDLVNDFFGIRKNGCKAKYYKYMSDSEIRETHKDDKVATHKLMQCRI